MNGGRDESLMALLRGRVPRGRLDHGADRQQRAPQGRLRIPWPSLPTLAGTPWWAWAGGALGAVYAVAAVLLARELGAATLMSLVVTGQLICSVVLDHFGWVGFTEHAAGMGRIVGCLLMLAGFFLIARP